MENITPVTILFGKKLRALREKANLSQDELAKILNVSRGSISFYEKGERVPNIEFLAAVADLFDVSYYYLMGDIETYHPIKIDELPHLSNDVIEFLREYADAFNEVYYFDILGALLKNKKFQSALYDLNFITVDYSRCLRAMIHDEHALEKEKGRLDLWDREYFTFKIATEMVDACNIIVDELAGKTLSKEEWEQVLQNHNNRVVESQKKQKNEQEKLNAYIEEEIDTIVRRRIHGLRPNKKGENQ